VVRTTFLFIQHRSVVLTALHAMQTRSSDEKACPVRLSVKLVDCDKTEERSVQIFIPYERSFPTVGLQLN